MIELSNLDTFNNLPPIIATQFEVVKIVQVASLGAIVWDVFSFIPEDVKVLRQGGGLVTSICFILTRLLAVVHTTLWVVMSTHPVANCQEMVVAANTVCFFLMGATSFLFLRRAQAVYIGNRLAYWIFALLFACSSTSHIMMILGMEAEHIPGTKYCGTSKVELYAMITYFMPGFFDTVVFLAISYKIAYQDYQYRSDKGGNPVTRFFSSKTLPRLSRAVLQGGQQYYLAAIIYRLVSVIVTFDPSVPALYNSLVLAPGVVITSSTACRVHRLLVLASYDSNEEMFKTRANVVSIQFANPDLINEKPFTHPSIENTPVTTNYTHSSMIPV